MGGRQMAARFFYARRGGMVLRRLMLTAYPEDWGQLGGGAWTEEKKIGEAGFVFCKKFLSKM